MHIPDLYADVDLQMLKKKVEALETALNAAPPSKTWVSLTDERLSEIYNDLYTQYTRDDVNIVDFILIARTIEKELNAAPTAQTVNDKPCKCIDQFWCATFDRCKRNESI